MSLAEAQRLIATDWLSRELTFCSPGGKCNQNATSFQKPKSEAPLRRAFRARRVGLERDMRVVSLAALVLVAGCITPDLSKICPYKATITQGVFGGIFDASGAVEESVKVDLYTTLNGVQGTLGASAQTTLAGYQLHVDPAP
jgi:hypothetical protein